MALATDFLMFALKLAFVRGQRPNRLDKKCRPCSAQVVGFKLVPVSFLFEVNLGNVQRLR